LKISLVYLGHPILFFGYLFLLLDKTIAGVNASTKVSTNVYRINICLYIAVTLTVFLVWLVIQVEVFKRFSGFQVDQFLSRQASVPSLLAAIPGLLNLYVWTGQGMEGNVFGFLFFLPLLIASVMYVILWIVCAVESFVPRVVSMEESELSAAMV